MAPYRPPRTECKHSAREPRGRRAACTPRATLTLGLERPSRARRYTPLEWTTLPSRSASRCYLKVLCDVSAGERLIGLHMVGEHAAEILPGLALAMRLGATKADLDATIGVHPTSGEELTSLRVTKRSGDDPAKGGC